MANLLTKIEAYKREEIMEAKRSRSLAALQREADAAPSPRGFLAAVEHRLDQGNYALIGEIKKASPSKGLIRNDFDPRVLARAYEKGGATCLSVLTDTPSFQGGLEHMSEARSATSIPVLRKDFMYDSYQVVEARVWGADCILIMLSTVDDVMAKELENTAFSLGMDVLVEVHDDEELDRASHLHSRLIGINNRNLKTFDTTLATSELLAPKVSDSRVIVGESGIEGPDDLTRLVKVGISTFLIGDSLLRSAEVEASTRALLKPAMKSVPPVQ